MALIHFGKKTKIFLKLGLLLIIIIIDFKIPTIFFF